MTRAALGAVALSTALLARAQVASAYSPEVNYALHCQGCHLADGRATPGLVPALDGTLGRMMRLAAGRSYVVRLPNVAATHLDDADTAALVTWVVRRFAGDELPSDFVAFSPDEVAAGRRAPLVDVDGARRNVLEQLDRAPGRVE